MTHTFKFEQGDYSYSGELDITPSGTQAYTLEGKVKMGPAVESILRSIFEQLGNLEAMSELKQLSIQRN